MINPQNFEIETEVSPAFYGQILDFIYKYYLFPQPDRFITIKKNVSKGYLSFVLDVNQSKKNRIPENVPDASGFNKAIPGENDSENGSTIKGKIESGEKINVTLTTEGDVPKKVLDQLAEDIFVAVQLYEENIRQSTIYFAWAEGQDIIPEKPPSVRKKASKRLFGSSLLLFYVLFFGINIILFIFIGFYAVIFILLIQLIIVLLSDKLYMRMGEWKITPENPNVHIIQYQLPEDEYKFFKENLGENALMQVKKEIYDNSLAKGKSPKCDVGEEVLSKYGFHCNPSRRRSRVINVYNIVKEAADKFGLPVPKIIVSNNMLPNAAATGPSPSRG
ncbi:MAG TPA: heat-shock protein HtpX, partial [Methanobacteriaceae archaeon]|nr:heat-shock protein HtpX [Methanobacteriaceae archaeon]